MNPNDPDYLALAEGGLGEVLGTTETIVSNLLLINYLLITNIY